MQNFWRSLVLAGLALSLPVAAGTGGTPGFGLEQTCNLSGKMETFDPYARFLPDNLSSTTFEISNSYSLDLKSLRADDMSQYQFRPVDNRGYGAGYSSPYLWEAGRGPGGGQMLGPGSWRGQVDGRSFSPVPMPGR